MYCINWYKHTSLVEFKLVLLLRFKRMLCAFAVRLQIFSRSFHACVSFCLLARKKKLENRQTRFNEN